MNKQNKRIIFAFLSFLFAGIFSSKALARSCYPVTLDLGPYVGFDVQMRNTGFTQNYGDNIFAKQYQQGNLYLGLMFTECLGVELGYEKTLVKSRASSFSGGDFVLGNRVTAGDNGKFKSRSQFYGPHINIVGVYQLSQEYPLEVFASLGAAYLTAKFDRELIEFLGEPESDLRTFERDKAVWRASIGLQYLFAECLGIRANLGWENTSQINLFQREPVPVVSQIKLKDSLLWGLGLFYVF